MAYGFNEKTCQRIEKSVSKTERNNRNLGKNKNSLILSSEAESPFYFQIISGSEANQYTVKSGYVSFGWTSAPIPEYTFTATGTSTIYIELKLTYNTDYTITALMQKVSTTTQSQFNYDIYQIGYLNYLEDDETFEIVQGVKGQIYQWGRIV